MTGSNEMKMAAVFIRESMLSNWEGSSAIAAEAVKRGPEFVINFLASIGGLLLGVAMSDPEGHTERISTLDKIAAEGN